MKVVRIIVWLKNGKTILRVWKEHQLAPVLLIAFIHHYKLLILLKIKPPPKGGGNHRE